MSNVNIVADGITYWKPVMLSCSIANKKLHANTIHSYRSLRKIFVWMARIAEGKEEEKTVTWMGCLLFQWSWAFPGIERYLSVITFNRIHANAYTPGKLDIQNGFNSKIWQQVDPFNSSTKQTFMEKCFDDIILIFSSVGIPIKYMYKEMFLFN